MREGWVILLLLVPASIATSTIRECCHESLYAAAGEIRQRYRIWSECGDELICTLHCVPKPMETTDRELNIKVVVDTNLVNKIHVSKISKESNGFEIVINNATTDLPSEPPTEQDTVPPLPSTTVLAMPPQPTVPYFISRKSLAPTENQVLFTTTTLAPPPSTPKTSKSPCPCVKAHSRSSTTSTSTTASPISTTPCPCHHHRGKKPTPKVDSKAVSTTETGVRIKTSSVYEVLAETTTQWDETWENCTETTTEPIST